MNTIELQPLTSPVKAIIAVPGSKSYTNRALIMAVMTKNEVQILNPLFSDDTKAMIECLQQLGITIEVSDQYILVKGDVWQVQDKEYHLDAQLSGTTMRFIVPLLCLVPGTKIIKGQKSLNKRPIKDLVEGLRQLGAQIEYIADEGFPPLKITSSAFNHSKIKMNGDVSSQYFSALFMITPLLKESLEIEVLGNQISKSYIDMTIQMMKEWGVEVENSKYQKYTIKNQPYSINKYTVEGDFSAAGYFFAIGALTKSTITLTNMNAKSVQGDKKFLDILQQMGNDGSCAQNEITIVGKGVKAVTVDMEQCPDQAQTLAVLASFAEGKTVMTGVRSLRVKETERVKAVQNELAKMGIKTESPNEDTLIIHGGNPQSATVDTYNDHRMAMSFAVAGSMLKGMKINNPEVVNKTFPEFWEKLKSLGIKVI